MPGFTPQNRGNKSSGPRFGTVVSRQLKKAGYNPRSPNDWGRKEGIFVKNRGEYVSVAVDFDMHSEAVRMTESLHETLSSLGYNVSRSSETSLKVEHSGKETMAVKLTDAQRAILPKLMAIGAIKTPRPKSELTAIGVSTSTLRSFLLKGVLSEPMGGYYKLTDVGKELAEALTASESAEEPPTEAEVPTEDEKPVESVSEPSRPRRTGRRTANVQALIDQGYSRAHAENFVKMLEENADA